MDFRDRLFSELPAEFCKRSFVTVEKVRVWSEKGSLADALVHCTSHPLALTLLALKISALFTGSLFFRQRPHHQVEQPTHHH
jgi:hypothetical protein